ncbi:MAG: hypothetical protein ACP5II_07730 [Infirmifilum sp.]|jgi:exonuclease VII small subunit|uniref:Uncharacterized protein n=1 Tax=Infirmifilum uzonense TaxID=1550241 RepID=A0A0F7FHX4_9CREN|nr:hypothetical protein [Infirmifilum uzonense]AKG38952.1 hypothetical protein MA03_06385 [Infirmifilum uzonense]
MATMALEEIKNIFDGADKAWEEYVSTTKQALLQWEKTRPALLEKIAVLKTRISSNLSELEEIQLKVELGLLEEEKSQKKFDELSSETVTMVHELENLWVAYEHASLKSIQHMKRIGIPLDTSLEETKKKLEEIENSFRDGIISSKEVYEELRKTVEEQIRILTG